MNVHNQQVQLSLSQLYIPPFFSGIFLFVIQLSLCYITILSSMHNSPQDK